MGKSSQLIHKWAILSYFVYSYVTIRQKENPDLDS